MNKTTDMKTTPKQKARQIVKKAYQTCKESTMSPPEDYSNLSIKDLKNRLEELDQDVFETGLELNRTHINDPLRRDKEYVHRKAKSARDNLKAHLDTILHVEEYMEEFEKDQLDETIVTTNRNGGYWAKTTEVPDSFPVYSDSGKHIGETWAETDHNGKPTGNYGGSHNDGTVWDSHPSRRSIRETIKQWHRTQQNLGSRKTVHKEEAGHLDEGLLDTRPETMRIIGRSGSNLVKAKHENLINHYLGLLASNASDEEIKQAEDAINLSAKRMPRRLENMGHLQHLIRRANRSEVSEDVNHDCGCDECISEGNLEEGLRNPKDNPCWKGYKPVGTKKKNGRTVPNCVPMESYVSEDVKLASQHLLAEVSDSPFRPAVPPILDLANAIGKQNRFYKKIKLHAQLLLSVAPAHHNASADNVGRLPAKYRDKILLAVLQHAPESDAKRYLKRSGFRKKEDKPKRKQANFKPQNTKKSPNKGKEK